MLVKKLDSIIEINRYLGGECSFHQAVKLGGIGSIKIIYEKGINEFDSVSELNKDLNYCSFQRFKNGIAVFMIKKGIGSTIAFRFSEIMKIRLDITPIRIRRRFFNKIVHKADLKILTRDAQIDFKVQTSSFKSFDRFLDRHLSEIEIQRTTQTPIIDGGNRLLEKILRLFE